MSPAAAPSVESFAFLDAPVGRYARSSEAYHISPAHRFRALEDPQLVEFVPKVECDRTVEQVSRNLLAMQAAR